MRHQTDEIGAAEDFPDYLQSFDALSQHFNSHLDGLSSTEKGREFAHFVQQLIPQAELGSDFEFPTMSSKESNDDGVDLTAQGKDRRSVLYVQARLGLNRAEAIDSILSTFQAYSAGRHPSGQLPLFSAADPTSYYLVVTLSPLTNILNRYKDRCGVIPV